MSARAAEPAPPWGQGVSFFSHRTGDARHAVNPIERGLVHGHRVTPGQDPQVGHNGYIRKRIVIRVGADVEQEIQEVQLAHCRHVDGSGGFDNPLLETGRGFPLDRQGPTRTRSGAVVGTPSTQLLVEVQDVLAEAERFLETVADTQAATVTTIGQHNRLQRLVNPPFTAPGTAAQARIGYRAGETGKGVGSYVRNDDQGLCFGNRSGDFDAAQLISLNGEQFVLLPGVSIGQDHVPADYGQRETVGRCRLQPGPIHIGADRIEPGRIHDHQLPAQTLNFLSDGTYQRWPKITKVAQFANINLNRDPFARFDYLLQPGSVQEISQPGHETGACVSRSRLHIVNQGHIKLPPFRVGIASCAHGKTHLTLITYISIQRQPTKESQSCPR